METFANFDFAGLGSSILGTTFDVIQKISDLKAQGKLQQDILNLSYAQQVDLENKLSLVKTQIEREGILFQYLAVQKNKEALDSVKRKRLFWLSALAGATVVLAIITLKLSNKNG